MNVRAVLYMFLALLGVSALAGAWAMIGSPDGSAMGASIGLLQNSPFPDFFWPGVILGLVFGLGSVKAIVLLALRWPIALRAAQVIGAGQMIWILVQVAMIREFHWLQLFFFNVGLGIFLAAEKCRRNDRRIARQAQ